MGENSAIQWTDNTWPIVQGCDPISQGCVRCYAVPLLWRLAHNPHPKVSGPLQGLTEYHVNAAGKTVLRFTGKLALREDRLDWPLKWSKPRMIFVPSHGDIFHKDVPDDFLDKIFAVMALCPQHTFQVLTKRSERMREYCARTGQRAAKIRLAALKWLDKRTEAELPLPNVWLGVSCEDQANADERIPHLLQTPAAIRFVSAEPLIGPIDFAVIARTQAEGYMRPLDGRFNKLDWIIIGGESGRKARAFDLDWGRSILQQCRASGVSAFMKQLGSNPYSDGRPMHGNPSGKYGDPAEWPPELRVREFPRAQHDGFPKVAA
jgi:protein gp37